jgi:hypothetical protein
MNMAIQSGYSKAAASNWDAIFAKKAEASFDFSAQDHVVPSEPTATPAAVFASIFEELDYWASFSAE